MSVSGVGSLVVTTYLGTQSNPKRKGTMLIGGAVMVGMSIAAFALTSRFVGSFPLAIESPYAVAMPPARWLWPSQSDRRCSTGRCAIWGNW